MILQGISKHPYFERSWVLNNYKSVIHNYALVEKHEMFILK